MLRILVRINSYFKFSYFLLRNSIFLFDIFENIIKFRMHFSRVNDSFFPAIVIIQKFLEYFVIVFYLCKAVGCVSPFDLVMGWDIVLQFLT